MEMLERILKAYIGIGLAVLAMQVAAAKYLERPACVGGLSHMLIDRVFPPVDDTTILMNTTQGKREEPLLPRLVLQAIRWAPDLYSHVVAGDMRLRDYIRGGAVCHPPLQFDRSKIWIMRPPLASVLRIDHTVHGRTGLRLPR
jgi:hypothetical protein